MSIIEPKIDVLLNETDNDRFLLCALASKRAHDINDMMRGQRDRAIQLQTAVEIARAADKKPLSLAFNEIARGEVSYDPNSIDVNYHYEIPSAYGRRNCSTLRSPEAPRLAAPSPRVAYGSTRPRAFAALQGASGLLADLLPTCVFVSRYARSLCIEGYP